MKTRQILSVIHIAGLLVVAQYILAFFVYNLPGLKALQYAGWLVWVPALIFGIGPIFVLRRKGGVAKGKSYVETTRLVDTSLYAIVRHPQYLGMLLFSLALMLMAQQWLVILMGIFSMGLIYQGIRDADQDGIQKFGEDYRQYMQRVPQFNFLLGIYRLFQAKRAAQR